MLSQKNYYQNSIILLKFKWYICLVSEIFLNIPSSAFQCASASQNFKNNCWNSGLLRHPAQKILPDSGTYACAVCLENTWELIEFPIIQFPHQTSVLRICKKKFNLVLVQPRRQQLGYGAAVSRWDLGSKLLWSTLSLFFLV